MLITSFWALTIGTNFCAQSRPPKDRPWYLVLVDNSIHQTYVAERNLEISEDISSIHHPMLDHYFIVMENGKYQLRTRKN